MLRHGAFGKLRNPWDSVLTGGLMCCESAGGNGLERALDEGGPLAWWPGRKAAVCGFHLLPACPPSSFPPQFPGCCEGAALLRGDISVLEPGTHELSP